MRLRPALLIQTAFAAAVFAGAAPAHAAPPVVIAQGHVDVVDLEYADGGFELHVHDESVEPGVEHDPADVLFKVRPEAKTTVPDDPAYGFLGSPGSTVWLLPETQDPDLLWPGLSTEELTAGVFATDSVSLTLNSVRGPGKVSVFTTDPFGAPIVLLNSGDGTPDSLALPVGSHQHANWGFTKEGTYRLTITASATLVDGTTVTSAPTVFTFCVQ